MSSETGKVRSTPGRGDWKMMNYGKGVGKKSWRENGVESDGQMCERAESGGAGRRRVLREQDKEKGDECGWWWWWWEGLERLAG